MAKAGRKLHDITGEVFGRLTAIRVVSHGTNQPTMWECQCGCGNSVVVWIRSLRKGVTRSCGCLSREIDPWRSYKHGMSNTPTYGTWTEMLRRCTDPTREAFARYGGRGISVCKRWYTFENFLEGMGTRPEGKSLDRKDNDGNYEKNNCRWATRRQQANNMWNNQWITYQGKTRTVAQWSRRLELEYGTLISRVHRHPEWTPAQLLQPLLQPRIAQKNRPHTLK